VTEFLKSINISRIYRHEYRVSFFDSQCIIWLRLGSVKMFFSTCTAINGEKKMIK